MNRFTFVNQLNITLLVHYTWGNVLKLAKHSHVAMLNIISVRCGIGGVIFGRYGNKYQLMLFMMKSCVVFVIFVYFLLSTIVNPLDITMKRVIPMENYRYSLERYTGIQKANFSRDVQISHYLGPKNPPISRLDDVGDENTEKSVYMDDKSQSLLWVDSPSQSLTRNEGLHADSINARNIQTGAVKRLPQVIIIGVKKSGTRALLEFLRIHPSVRAPGPEPHFFDQHYNKGLEWYREQMPATEEGQITVEKTPSYFVTKEVPKRIYHMNKTINLIVVVRNPVTRAISDYAQAAAKRPDITRFEQLAFVDNTSRIVNTKWGAVRIGVYAKYLERWLKYFPLDQIHFVNGEKLISDPAGEMYRVQDFLGLKRLVTDKHFYFKESWRFPCLKKHPVSGQPHCLRNSKGRRHPHVDSQVLIKLRDFFKPFNLKFYQLTGINFNWL